MSTRVALLASLACKGKEAKLTDPWSANLVFLTKQICEISTGILFYDIPKEDILTKKKSAKRHGRFSGCGASQCQGRSIGDLVYDFVAAERIMPRQHWQYTVTATVLVYGYPLNWVNQARIYVPALPAAFTFISLKVLTVTVTPQQYAQWCVRGIAYKTARKKIGISPIRLRVTHCQWRPVWLALPLHASTCRLPGIAVNLSNLAKCWRGMSHKTLSRKAKMALTGI